MIGSCRRFGLRCASCRRRSRPHLRRHLDLCQGAQRCQASIRKEELQQVSTLCRLYTGARLTLSFQYLEGLSGRSLSRRIFLNEVDISPASLLWEHNRYPIDNADIISGLGGRRASSTTSITTVNQSRSSRVVSRNETPTGERKDQRWGSFVRRPSAGRRDQPPAGSFLRSPPLEEEDITSSSEESVSEEDDSSHRSPRFRRFGKFSTQRAGLRDDEDDEDDTPAFLPMSREAEQAPAPRSGAELGATRKQDAERAAAAAARQRLTGESSSPGPVSTESPTSSISSGPPVHRPQAADRRTETLSPHRVGQAPRLSPRKSEASAREASDGTPSMGSSFSDLDGESLWVIPFSFHAK